MYCRIIGNAAIIVLLSFNAAVGHADTEVKSTLDQASDFIETGKPDSAAVLIYKHLNSISNLGERVRAYFYLSRAMNQLGRLGEEIQYLILARETSQEAPFSENVNIEYARLLLITGNIDECIGVTNEFRERYKNSPYLPEVLYIAGNALFSRGEYHRAFNLFDTVTEQYIDSEVGPESVEKAGMCLFHLDFIGGAIERFETFLKYNRPGMETAEALHYLGMSYEAAGQPDHAYRLYDRLTIEYPSYPGILDIYFKLGTTSLAAGSYTKAKHAFLNYTANADTSEERYDEALLNLERINFKTGIYSSEIEIYEHFVSNYPGSRLVPKMLFDLANYYRLSGNTIEAIDKYRILLSNPLYEAYADSAAFLIADTYAEMDKLDQAVAFLSSFLFESADSVRTQRYLLRIGAIHESRGIYEEAIAWYDSCHNLGFSDELTVHALIGIGRVFKSLDRWMESGKTYEHIIEEYPDYPAIKDVYLALSDIYYLEGQLEKAAVTAEQAIKYAEQLEKAEILLYIAELYREFDERHALRLYSIVFKNKQNSSTQITKALWEFGDLALRIGDKESARRAFAAVIDTGTDSVLVRRAVERLSKLGGNVPGGSFKSILSD